MKEYGMSTRVSGTIKKRELYDLWVVADCLMSFCEFKDRILAAIQPDPEPKPVAQDTICDDCGKLVRHNTAHWMDDGASYCPICRPLPATPSSAGTVSVEAHECEKLKHDNALLGQAVSLMQDLCKREVDRITEHLHKIATAHPDTFEGRGAREYALRALAGDTP